MSSYTTPEAVQSELQSTQSFSSNTIPSLSDITEWIEEESNDLDEDVGMSFASTQDTVYLDYNGEEYIPLKYAPIISIDSFEYNPRALGSRDGSEWESKTEDEHFALYPKRGEVVILFNRFNPKTGKKRFKIVYTYGYSSIPSKVQKYIKKKVALRVLNTLIYKNVNERNDGGSVSVGSINIVEPEAYGVKSYKQLKEDANELYNRLIDTSGVYRYDIYEEV